MKDVLDNIEREIQQQTKRTRAGGGKLVPALFIRLNSASCNPYYSSPPRSPFPDSDDDDDDAFYDGETKGLVSFLSCNWSPPVFISIYHQLFIQYHLVFV